MFWLLEFCAARADFATMFTAWSAVLPLLKADWQMAAWQAGMVQSAYHVGFLVSLFAVGFLSDRYGARRIYLASGIAAVTPLNAVDMVPSWAGMVSAWASISPCGVNTAQE